MKKSYKIALIAFILFIIIGLIMLLSPFAIALLRYTNNPYVDFSEYANGYTAIAKRIEEKIDFDKDFDLKVREKYWGSSVYSDSFINSLIFNIYDTSIQSYDNNVTLDLSEEDIGFIKKIQKVHFPGENLDFVRVLENIMIFEREGGLKHELVYSINGKRPPLKYAGSYYISIKLYEDWYVCIRVDPLW